ncbi:MAG: HypC/HybG/HupF family hydrogenase formation chaperone [Coriobacteriaceae bacterium]|nr:HypC/HybG/HupF family hydrogenase formation chaperone [Coriobacteriaceae bacterium]
MCLAIPAQIVSIGELNMAEVDIVGVTRHVSLEMVPEAKPGDYVLVHAGFAIQVVDEEYANETLEYLKQLSIVETEV